jgi:hypothetical protein
LLLKNEILEVELLQVPVFKRWYYKPESVEINGCQEDGCLYINGRPMPWHQWNIKTSADKSSILYELEHSETGLRLNVTVTLDGGIVKYIVDSIIEGDEPVYSIDFKKMPIFRFGGDFSFFRDYYRRTHWDSEMARGLWYKDYEEVSVSGAQPDDSWKSNVHACAYNGKVSCFVKTNWPILPLWTRAVESKKFTERSDCFELGISGWQYRIRNKIIDRYEAHIELVPDLNGDGRADECEYQLSMKKLLPDPDELYRDTIWYKVFCASPQGVFTTFKQALEIAERIFYLSNGKPQVMYLVGWQYNGHDTGYPAMDKLNIKLGSREELLNLIKTAKERYKCIVSVHANIDDSYDQHPQWDPDLIGRDIDGSLMRWEVFNGVQSYHICHTKDVESKSIFRRIDEMLSVVPLERTVHFDAFRTMNWSWEQDGFIGEPEELFCGMLPIKGYMNTKGIDITTEALNGMRIEPSGVFSGLWHNGSLPLLYHNKIYGGGRGRTPAAFAAGTSINMDVTGSNLNEEADELKDRIAMDCMLYNFFLMHEMVEFRSKNKNRAYARYVDGIEAFGDNNANILKVIWQNILIADNTTRFIPFDDYIYVYSTEDCEINRVLPESWRDVDLYAEALIPGTEPPCICQINNMITLKVHARTPFILCRKKA